MGTEYVGIENPIALILHPVIEGAGFWLLGSHANLPVGKKGETAGDRNLGVVASVHPTKFLFSCCRNRKYENGSSIPLIVARQVVKCSSSVHSIDVVTPHTPQPRVERNACMHGDNTIQHTLYGHKLYRRQGFTFRTLNGDEWNVRGTIRGQEHRERKTGLATRLIMSLSLFWCCCQLVDRCARSWKSRQI